MQIHELNNYTGALGSGAFIAVDDGNDTGKLSTQQLLADTNADISELGETLNARIDNIIAGGAAPSEAEITDARLGAEGQLYASLGAAVRDQSDYGIENAIDLNKGQQNFGFISKFVQGYIYQGNVSPTIKYRYVSQDIMVFDRDINITIGNGFRMGYHQYNADGTYRYNAGWQTGTLTILAGTYFRAEIARTTDDTSEKAPYGEFVGSITFTSDLSVEIGKKIEKNPRLFVSESDVSMTGNAQFITKDFDIPCNTLGELCNIYVENTSNVTIAKPIRYRFLDDSNVIIGSDLWMAAGQIGTLYCPTGATKFRVSLYGTTSGELVSKTAHFYNVKMWKGNPTDDFIPNVLNNDIFAQNLTLEGFSRLPDNPLFPSIAHRGYGLTAPECTGAAVKEAKRRGFTGVENDVALTSDGEFVMWHDATLAKIGDSGHGVGDYTLAQLKTMDFGSWKNPIYAGEEILTFEEWVLLAKKLGLKLYVDTKFEYTNAQIEALAETVNNNGMMDYTTWYINFNGGYAERLRELYPKARLLWMGEPTIERCQILQERLAEGGPHSIVLAPTSSVITSSNYENAHNYGIDLECYFVSYEDSGLDLAQVKSEILRVSEFGLTGIVLDWYRAIDVINEEIY